MNKKRTINMRMREDMYNDLKNESDYTGNSISSIIRLAVLNREKTVSYNKDHDKKLSRIMEKLP